MLGAGLGLAALFLYLQTTSGSTTGATVTIVFGSLFGLTSAAIPPAVTASAVALCLLTALGRPAAPELDQPGAGRSARDCRFGWSAPPICSRSPVALAAYTIGAILSTALLVGPAATALRLTRSPGRAILLAAAIGVAAAWLGILLAYDSFAWPPRGTGWPVSFFVVTLIFLGYLLAGLSQRLRARGQTRR